MVARVIRSGVLIVLTALTLTGCGRQVSKESPQDLDLLATGPDRNALSAPRPFVSAVLDATGGLAAWEQCRKIEFQATVTASERDGSLYLTEHDFVLCPWSDAIQVTAHEPRANFTWQVVGGQYRAPQADPNLDVSPLRDVSGDYAGAVLQIATAPVRMLDDRIELTLAPAAVQIAGQWYLPIDAKYYATQFRWTKGIYFQRQDGSRVDMIWLGDPATRKFVIVRGYDYARSAGNGVLIPTKIEVFHSDPDANIGPRIALIDLRQ